MTTTYRVIRTSMCAATAAAFLNYDTTNINVAHQLCGDYNNFYCRGNCGCIFSVIEVESPDFSNSVTPLTWDINTIQPITITLPNNVWTTTNIPPSSQCIPITNTSAINGTVLTYNNANNQWISTNTTLTGDVSGSATNNTVRVATEPDIKF